MTRRLVADWARTGSWALPLSWPLLPCCAYLCKRASAAASFQPDLSLPPVVCCVLWSFIRMFPRCAGLVYGFSWYWYTHFTKIKSRADVFLTVLHAAVEPARTAVTSVPPLPVCEI